MTKPKCKDQDYATSLPKPSCTEKSAPQQSSRAKIGSWNLFNGSRESALAEYAKLCKEMKVQILAVQETKRKLSAVEDWRFNGNLDDWRFVGTGTSKNIGGVGFILGPDVELVEYVEHKEDCWGRIFSIRVVLYGMRLKLTNVYAPHEGYADSTKQNFYSKLKRCLKEMDSFKTGQQIVLGDFNAEIGFLDTEDYDEVVGSNIRLSKYTSDNGTFLLEFLNQRKLQLLNTFITTNRRHEATHFNVKNRKWRRIDYIDIATSRKFRSRFVRSCKAVTGLNLKYGKEMRGPGGYTDHNLLLMELVIPSKKKIKKVLKKKKGKKSKKYDISELQQEEARRVFSETLGSVLDQSGESIDEVNKNIMEAYLKAMNEVLPILERSENQTVEWDDPEVLKLQQELKSAKKLKDRKVIANKLAHARTQAKRKYYEKQALEINRHDARREIDKLYKKSKLYGKNTTQADASDYVTPQQLAKYFEKQFSSDPKYDEGPLPPEIEFYGTGKYEYLQDKMFEINESPPTSEEIKELLKSMKNGRSSGLDGIPMECMKYGDSPEIVEEIRKLQTMIWEYEQVPGRWLD